VTTSDTAPSPAPALTSRADVATEAPERYAKQLVSHLGRKVAFVEHHGTWTAHVADSVARIALGDGVLVLQAEAPDLGGLARLEHALGDHLERFGRRSELTVRWHRTTAPDA
jgi:hypothetical protein